MIEPDLLNELRRIVGGGHVSAGRADAEVYSYDASLAIGMPDVTVFPATAAETAAVVRAALQACVPCIPRGFGTNLSGGSVAPRGGIVLCLSRMNHILSIQPERRCAIVEAGVTNLELQNALAPLGFFFAPDPASQKVATLGGNVGENSGGPHCVKYGVTTNHILGMEAVLPDGEIVRLSGPALDPPGYDLRGLLIGSEGTLGIAAEVTCRILPLPEAVATFLVIYDSVAAAARSVSEIIAHGIVPATLEMMDSPVMRAVEQSFPSGFPLDAAAVLIVEVEGPAAGLDAQAESIRGICTANACRSIRKAKDAAERDGLWAGRRGAFGAIARIAPNFLVCDCTVPRNRLPDALDRAAAIAKSHGFGHGNVFHAGDGNLHPLLFFDARDRDQLRRVHEAGHEIMAACVGLGGTITGEHGVGAEKLEAMRMVFSDDDLRFQRTIKHVFDPAELLNPGKAVPSSAAGARFAGMQSGDTSPHSIILPGQEQAPGPSAPPKDGEDYGVRRNRAAFDPSGAEGHQTTSGIRGRPQGFRPPLSTPPEGDLAPSDEAEAARMVQAAYEQRLALLPVGSARRADFGNHSDQPTIPLRSEKLDKLVEHDADNQTVTVGAGMKLTALQQLLAAHRQWLPIRPPLAEHCTVGGMVALGACGPERLAYGAPRDRLLGLRFIDGLGRPIHAGGKVVKNVAGYDVTRLMAGSAGTLGFLTELTFRVAALPEVCRAASATGPLHACGAAGAALLRSNLEPASVTATLPAASAPESGICNLESVICNLQSVIWELTVAFEGLATTVSSQLDRCAGLLREAGLEAQEPRAYDCREGAGPGVFSRLFGSSFVLRAGLPLDQVANFLSEAKDVLEWPNILLDFGCGRVTAGIAELTDEAWASLCAIAAKLDGHVLLEKAPVEFKKRNDVFGPPRPEWKLMHRLKSALDPRNLFSPGRLPGRR